VSQPEPGWAVGLKLENPKVFGASSGPNDRRSLPLTVCKHIPVRSHSTPLYYMKPYLNTHNTALQ